MIFIVQRRVQRTSLGLTLIRIGVDSQCQNKLAVESLFRLKLQLKNRTQWADSEEGYVMGEIENVLGLCVSSFTPYCIPLN